MYQDFHHAFRRLRQSPGFTLVAILTLALGLGANFTVFSMVSEFMFRPLRVAQPDELVFLMQKSPKLGMPYAISYADYRDLREDLVGPRGGGADDQHIFQDMLAYATVPVHLSERGQMPERAWVHAVSANYFEMLGVHAELGRVFLPGEGVQPGADPIVVLNHDFWKERFHGDARVIGQTVNVNGEAFTVVGVTMERFGGAEAMTRADMFAPVMMADVLQPNSKGALENRWASAFMTMGRLHPGVSLAQSQTVARARWSQLLADFPDFHAPSELLLVPEQSSRPTPYVSQFAPAALAALMLLGTLVLIVAMANIANLLYARSAGAARTLAIRSSLGATRWRLVRYLLSESLLLAIGAGVAGWFVSNLFGLLLQSVSISPDNPPTANPSADWRPIAYAAAAAIATGLITGVFPALRATRRDMLPQLNESARSVINTRHPLRSILVAGQVALSCIVLVCAGMAVHSLYVLSKADLGFRPKNVLLATFDLELQRYESEQAAQFQKSLLDEVRALPGVKAASLARAAPFEPRIGLQGGVGAEGQPPPDREDLYLIATVSTAPDYIETMGIPLLAGRDFTEHDTSDAPHVAIVNEALAQHFWPGENALGKRLVFHGTRLVEVIGVMRTGRYFMMSDRDRPVLFQPIAQQPTPNFTVAIHTAIDPLQLARPLQQVVQRLDANVPVFNVRSLEQHIMGSALGLMPLQFGAIAAGTQGALVLFLAVMGLYGLVSFAVACRTREIGIRMALGATRRDILTLITRPSLVLTAIGAMIGLVLAFLLSRPLTGLLYGATPNDVLVFGAVAFLICAATVAAAWMPARRAARIDPVEALRAE